jgi:hypothetical protein
MLSIFLQSLHVVIRKLIFTVRHPRSNLSRDGPQDRILTFFRQKLIALRLSKNLYWILDDFDGPLMSSSNYQVPREGEKILEQ